MKINGKSVPESEFKQLRDAAMKVDKSAAIFQYHYEIMKLCVWSGSDSGKIKRTFDRCLLNNSFSLGVWLLYGMSFLPKKVVRHLYAYIKGRLYRPVVIGS